MDAAAPPTPPTAEREPLSLGEIRDVWPLLAHADRIEGFLLLPRDEAEDFFFGLSARDQADLVCGMPAREQRSWVRLLPPDDAADLIQAAPTEKRDALLALLDEPTRREVTALLAYSEDNAGGLMNPRYIRLRPEMTVDEAISYVRKQMREQPRTIYYGYVLDGEQRLLGVVSFRELFTATVRTRVAEIMKRQVTTIPEQMDQETVSHKFAQAHLVALPVVDAEGQMKGIVTVDDVVDVVQEEATEDMQKVGGVEALDAPYLQIELRKMIRKRVGWLSVLFLGEMLTASAMGFFEKEIARAVVLALFIPLIISSGGNSGSQATTLVIRAMALGEVRLRDWWRVIRREVVAGHRPRPGAGGDRLHPHRDLGGAVSHLRPAVPERGGHGGRQPGGRRAVGDDGRLDAAVHPAPVRLRPRQRLGAVRRHAGRRERPGHLLHGGRHRSCGGRCSDAARPPRRRLRRSARLRLAARRSRSLGALRRGRRARRSRPADPRRRAGQHRLPAAAAHLGVRGARRRRAAARTASPPTARPGPTSTTCSSCSRTRSRSRTRRRCEAVREVLDDLVCLSLPVARIWGFNDSKDTSSIRRSPEEGFREEGLRGLDQAVWEAKRRGIRLIVPLVNNWGEYGGLPAYAAWASASSTAARSTATTSSATPQMKQWWKDYAFMLVNRVNTFTGDRLPRRAGHPRLGDRQRAALLELRGDDPAARHRRRAGDLPQADRAQPAGRRRRRRVRRRSRRRTPG